MEHVPVVHFYWLLLLAAATPLALLLWLGRKNRWWLPCGAVLLYTRLEISAYYKGRNPPAPVVQTAFPQQSVQAEHFLERIRRPLMPLDQLPQPENWRHALFARLTEDFAPDKQLILDFHPDLTEREALIFYLTARTHGSMPTYAVRACVPTYLSQLLYSPRGKP